MPEGTHEIDLVKDHGRLRSIEEERIEYYDLVEGPYRFGRSCHLWDTHNH